MVVIAVLCIGIGMIPGLFYAMLPFKVGLSALLRQVTWSPNAASFLVASPYLSHADRHQAHSSTIKLDFDWFYRRLGRKLGEAVEDESNAERGSGWSSAVGSGARRMNDRLHRHHGPEGVLGRTWPTGTMAFWTTVMLAAYLILVKPLTARTSMDRLRELFENLLYPELQAYGRKDRDRLLQEASKEPYDFLEWVGILAALVLVVSFTRYGVAGFSLVDRFAVMLANFLVAVPLLVVTVGPFLVRRTRRGLQKRRR